MTWVFCGGMIRSGSTLQFQLAATIVEEAGRGERVRYAPEAQFDDVRRDVTDPSRLHVFKAHICAPEFERECREAGGRVVYSYRDIRDVAVSSVRKFGLSLEELLSRGWLDQAVGDYYRWTSLPRVSVSRYEEMYADVGGEARKIDAFLGIGLGAARLEGLASRYTIEEQRRRVAGIRAANEERISRGEVVFDAKELLHHNHIHEGEPGGWRRLLSPPQQELLNDRYSTWIRDTGYPAR